jgi:hypothetical protein
MWNAMWRDVMDRLSPPKTVPAREAISRIRESSGAFPVIRPATTSLGEVVPFAAETQSPQSSVAPPPWSEVFPGHYRALVADLAKRGEGIANWEIRDGRDLGVTDAGHAVAFTLHKTGTSATIQVELTLFKGQLAAVRVR